MRISNQTTTSRRPRVAGILVMLSHGQYQERTARQEAGISAPAWDAARAATSCGVWLLEQLFERVAMRGEEQLVLVAAGGMLGLDDVQQACDWNFDPFDEKRTPRIPNLLRKSPARPGRRDSLRRRR